MVDLIIMFLEFSQRMRHFKPAIHYSQARRIWDETIFSPNKIMFAKTGWMCYYKPFVVRCTFSHEHICHWEFFLTKNSYVFVEETATSMQILRTVYSEKPVCETWRKPTINYSLYVILPLFRRCSQIVYSPIHTSRHCLQTITKLLFCEKKLSFAKRDEKRSTHY